MTSFGPYSGLDVEAGLALGLGVRGDGGLDFTG
jgi:hypothetical protein